MTGQNVGYMRVSTTVQSTERQLDKVDLDQVFTDKLSGKDTARPQLDACMNHLRKGDTLHVHSIDRLARNLLDLQRLVEELTAKGVTIKFHKEALTFNGEENAMSKLMLQMIGAVAEFERSLINERRKEGVAIAQKKGVKFGRPSKLTDDQMKAILAKVDAGQNKKSIAMEFGISRASVYDIINRDHS
ncbi:recombinase family protein [Desulfomicrobium baculatum]|uniref:Resolvase domain protein n=1 Tax=Desulfomicrobium baculatum (strain DSM 4028 / VKM B-1378 / X) TaxID=525897 RepID=C7LPF9_DESBD|nr:recombinase family protein [Desulfomicrobium baculatum]ACU89002.1 Resolvase domain protein [Desulfomicrobium baculatum DSM 4028]